MVRSFVSVKTICYGGKKTSWGTAARRVNVCVRWVNVCVRWVNLCVSCVNAGEGRWIGDDVVMTYKKEFSKKRNKSLLK